MTGALPDAALLNAIAHGLYALAAVALLLLGFATLLARHAPPPLAHGAAQGAMLALGLLAQSWVQGSTMLLATAALLGGAKVVGLPLLLRQVPPEGAAALPRATLAVAGIALVALAAWLGAPGPVSFGGPSAFGGIEVAAPLALALLGCLGLALRTDPRGRIGSVLALENATILAASAVAGLPGLPLLALAACGLSAACVAVLFRHALPGRAP